MPLDGGNIFPKGETGLPFRAGLTFGCDPGRQVMSSIEDGHPSERKTARVIRLHGRFKSRRSFVAHYDGCPVGHSLLPVQPRPGPARPGQAAGPRGLQRAGRMQLTNQCAQGRRTQELRLHRASLALTDGVQEPSNGCDKGQTLSTLSE